MYACIISGVPALACLPSSRLKIIREKNMPAGGDNKPKSGSSSSTSSQKMGAPQKIYDINESTVKSRIYAGLAVIFVVIIIIAVFAIAAAQ